MKATPYGSVSLLGDPRIRDTGQPHCWTHFWMEPFLLQTCSGHTEPASPKVKAEELGAAVRLRRPRRQGMRISQPEDNLSAPPPHLSDTEGTEALKQFQHHPTTSSLVVPPCSSYLLPGQMPARPALLLDDTPAGAVPLNCTASAPGSGPCHPLS